MSQLTCSLMGLSGVLAPQEAFCGRSLSAVMAKLLSVALMCFAEDASSQACPTMKSWVLCWWAAAWRSLLEVARAVLPYMTR